MYYSIYKTIANALIIIVFIGFSSFILKKSIGNKEIKAEQNAFALLELFTSQGCSSCPAADAILAKYALQINPNIIPLAFHVDYWNYIGWKDPFSKAQFTERQREYTKKFNTQGNYTPQLVINGKHELVGSKENTIESLINKELAVKNQFYIKIKKAYINEKKLTIEYETNAVTTNTITNLALVKKKRIHKYKRWRE